ncbi:hypothetical protein ACN47E_000810 [Coniothyrium glycines]
MAARSKNLAIGSAGWILEERHQSNALVTQELEDFGFSVRNELEWLNEHMLDMFAQTAQNNLDVFKTPGKLRGKTPRTARKKGLDARQPLSTILSANGQARLSAAEQSLRRNLQKSAAKARFHIAEDTENTPREQTPAAKTPIARQLFSKASSASRELVDDRSPLGAFLDRPSLVPAAQAWKPTQSTQDTIMSFHDNDDDVFSQTSQPQSTQPTQPATSFNRSEHKEDDERRDTGDSFVSAKEALHSKTASRENLRENDFDAMDVDHDREDSSRSSAQGTVVHHDISSILDGDEDMQDILDFPQPPRVVSEQYSISAETQDALDTANIRALAPEPKNLLAPYHSTTPAGPPPASTSPEILVHDDTVVHHDTDDQMDAEDDVRSPSESSSPAKPLVRKSSLTFAPLPGRDPLPPKKSMGNRVSRTSHLDASKARSSHMGRFTGGKSLGGSQLAYPADTHSADEGLADFERPELQREESETTKIHNKTSTQRLYERINMLKQQNEMPNRLSHNITASQVSQAQSSASTQPKDDAPASQPAYPHLPPREADHEDEDDDWISQPTAATALVQKNNRPAFSKSHTADTLVSPPKLVPSKMVSVSNPDLPAVLGSTTPSGSPVSKKYMDGPLSASKSKLYSAFRAAKEKLIGSSATSAQAKLDVLHESPARPKLHAQPSSDDVFVSPKRIEKPNGSIFSHLRSPSKESARSVQPANASPSKGDARRTRSSTEREKQKVKEVREKEAKEAKQQQRADDRLREMREKEQTKAAAHHYKARAMGAKTPTAMLSQSSLRQPTSTTTLNKTPVAAARPDLSRSNSRDEDLNSADEMPPPPPPKSLLPTTKSTKATLREPRKLAKPASKDTLTKAKGPQRIMVQTNSSRYGQAPPPAARPAPAPGGKPLPAAPPTISRSNAPSTKTAPPASARPASALSSKSGTSSTAKSSQPVTKPAPPRVTRPQQQAPDKVKVAVTQPRSDLAAARPVSQMRTVQDANRINIPPVNTAKPPKRAFPTENDEPETLHRPAKRPSQQAKMNPITPAHAQFAKGKIPFADSAFASQSQVPQVQYPNGDDIKLPEIMTDSEDEDSENEFEQPSWVNTPNLREMLSNQQLMDPETIFGPIAPLEMEKVFPNKERHKRFRERTSSAYWANDEVTAEEKRKEREARERLVREGAWTYNPSPLPPRTGPAR